MRSIACISQKGGSGKSVLTTNLARIFQLRGDDVLIVDSDPQKSATDWSLESDQINAPPAVGVNGPVVHEQLPGLTKYDTVFVDGAGKIEDMTESIIRAVDAVLIPIKPAASELWASGQIIDMILNYQSRTDGPHAAFVVTQAITGSTLVRSVRESLSGMQLPVLDNTVHQRVVYVRAFNHGVSVMEMDDEKAKTEMTGVADETQQLLSNSYAIN